MEGEWQCVERADWADVPLTVTELTVVSFNTLRRNYRFNQNTYTAEEHRSFDGHRLKLHRSLFLDELGKSADLLCLEEVEQVEDFAFLADTYEYVQPLGNGKKQKKQAGQHSFTRPYLFYRRQRFELVWESQRSRAVLAQLADKQTGRTLLVASVHLQGGPAGETDRQNQLRNVSRFLGERLEALPEEAKAKAGIVIAGDFNCDMEADAFAAMGLRPAFGREDVPFTHKWGQGTPQFFSALDQVFWSEQTLRKVRFRNPFSSDEWIEYLRFKGIPNERHQSDHVPLVATFAYV